MYAFAFTLQIRPLFRRGLSGMPLGRGYRASRHGLDLATGCRLHDGTLSLVQGTHGGRGQQVRDLSTCVVPAHVKFVYFYRFRYITWPGQALGYKIGQMKIGELRKKAEVALGPKFDIKEFHEVVLMAAGPLEVVEMEVDDYVRRKAAAN